MRIRVIESTLIALIIFAFSGVNPAFAQSVCNDLQVIEVENDISLRNINPSISCDGRQIVWRGSGRAIDGTTNLIYHADCDGEVRLVSTETVFNSRPQLSSDGSTIVWAGTIVDENFLFASQDIYKSVNGGPQTLVSPVTSEGTSINNERAQVCADGSRIVWTGILNGVRHIFLNDGTSTIRVSDGQSTRNTSPQISEDCNIVTWEGYDPSTQSNHIYKYQNGTVSNISASSISSKNVDHVMSSDGSVIVYVGEDASGQDHIFSYSNGTTEQLSINISGQHTLPTISLDGSTIGWTNFDAATQQSRVYVSINGTVQEVINYQLASSVPVFLGSSISETGERFVWQDPFGNINIIDFTTGITELVATDMNFFGQELSISCNGEVVIWSAYVDDIHTDVYRNACTPSYCQEPVNENVGSIEVPGQEDNEPEPIDEMVEEEIPTEPIDEMVVEEIPAEPIDEMLVEDVPTMGEWGLICLGILFMVFATQCIKEREISIQTEKVKNK